VDNVSIEDEHKYLEWVIGGIVTATAAVVSWFNGKINRVSDKKLSKEVFEQFEKRNDDQHNQTHVSLAKIYDKLDGKQDK
jgi:hypothetical protein